MVKIRMASTAECDRVLWVLFLLDADQTICKDVLKLDKVRLAPTEFMCYLQCYLCCQ